MGVSGKRINRLDRRDLRKLENMLEELREEIEAGQWTRGRLAERAMKRLGLPVTHNNVDGALEAIELRMPHELRGNGEAGELAARLAELEARVAALEDSATSPAKPAGSPSLFAESNEELSA